MPRQYQPFYICSTMYMCDMFLKYKNLCLQSLLIHVVLSLMTIVYIADQDSVDHAKGDYNLIIFFQLFFSQCLDAWRYSMMTSA